MMKGLNTYNKIRYRSGCNPSTSEAHCLIDCYGIQVAEWGFDGDIAK